jgi:uncharacterized heparinase superfamily protein
MIGRLARTMVTLHPLQVAARPAHRLLAPLARAVPGALAPRAVEGWPAPPEALRRLANLERIRGAERLARLPAGSRLRAYEACYGLELGADGEVAHADWSSPVAMEPYPAAVRARRIAVAARCGRRGLEKELARAARAVLLQPELHLLGNHLLENGLGLACAGSASRGPEADLWWAVGMRLLGWQLPAQFLADGGHIERSASYHVALAAALLEAIELAQGAGRRVPGRWLEVASGALGWASAVRAPDGSYPLFNDAALDAAPTIDDVMVLGATLGIEPRAATLVEARDDARIVRLEPTGWVGLEVPGAHCFVDAGPDAEGWQPGHAHADGLTFEVWLGGERAIVDFGVASYEAGDAREMTRATRSHNTAQLGDRDSCEVWSAFRVGRRGRGRVVSRELRDRGVRVDLEHDGYASMSGSPRHARTITLRPGRLDVVDRMVGAEGEWSSRLRFDTSVAARVRVSTGLDARRRDAFWYAKHGEARPAVLFEQHVTTGSGRDIRWCVEW